MRVNLWINLLLALLFLQGCSDSISSLEEYNVWVNNPDNGLVKERNINGLSISLKYLPVDRQVYRDASSLELSKNDYDSIRSQYENTLTFLMSIDIDESTKTTGDIMYYNVQNKQEFIEKALTLNFDMGNYVTISTDDGSTYAPVLSNMENVYSMSTGRKFMFVFVPTEKNDKKLKTSEELIFTYDDNEFDLGKVNFKFDRETLDNIPKLNFKLNVI